jgi:ribonuclease PH
MPLERKSGRSTDSLRPIKISYDLFSYAPGSVLLELGDTKVLCTVSLQQGVPPFLRGKGKGGWLNAEYSLLPNATHVRTTRETSSTNRNGRTVEISRLISRVLRTVVDLSLLGEQTLFVDCDVLQADGGTRVASICAASLALEQAQTKLLASGAIKAVFLKESVAAVSVGVVRSEVLLDPDYVEDSTIDADFNIILTQSNRLIEIQGGAEKVPLSWDLFHQVQACAIKGVEQIFETTKNMKYAVALSSKVDDNGGVFAQKNDSNQGAKAPFFSLKNRLSMVDADAS